MKVGDLVSFQQSKTIWGLVLELGNRYWNGISWSVSHARVEWPDCNATWEITDRLEILKTT